MDWFLDLITNRFFIVSVSSWFVAQFLKTVIYALENKKWDWSRLFGDGGMPSGHSATVSSLAVMSGLTFGFDSFQFAVTAILAIIVCHDAMGVRQETVVHGDTGIAAFLRRGHSRQSHDGAGGQGHTAHLDVAGAEGAGY